MTDTKFKRVKLVTGVTLSEVGGCQKVVFDILTHLPEAEFDITLVTSPGGELIDWIRDYNSQSNSEIKIILLNSLKRDISFWDDLKALISHVFQRKQGSADKN